MTHSRRALRAVQNQGPAPEPLPAPGPRPRLVAAPPAEPAGAVRVRVPIAMHYFAPLSPDHVPVEREFTAPDGAVLGYLAHGRRATAGRDRTGGDTACVYLNGIESHTSWFARAAELLTTHGCDVFCLDRRGSGMNRENRGFVSGHVDSRATLLADLHAFVREFHLTYDRVVLIGLSWGGKLALAAALEHPEDCDGLVLITPGVSVRVDLSLGQKLRVLFGATLAPTTQVGIPITPEMFTRTPEFLAKLATDPLRLHTVSARFFRESRALDRGIAARIEELRLPVLLFLAGQDRIVDNDGVLALLRRAPAKLSVRLYPEQTHSIQFDAPERLVHDVAEWLATAPRQFH